MRALVNPARRNPRYNVWRGGIGAGRVPEIRYKKGVGELIYFSIYDMYAHVEIKRP